MRSKLKGLNHFIFIKNLMKLKLEIDLWEDILKTRDLQQIIYSYALKFTDLKKLKKKLYCLNFQ